MIKEPQGGREEKQKGALYVYNLKRKSSIVLVIIIVRKYCLRKYAMVKSCLEPDCQEYLDARIISSIRKPRYLSFAPSEPREPYSLFMSLVVQPSVIVIEPPVIVIDYCLSSSDIIESASAP